MLLGKTGCGKSATGNSILGIKKFHSSVSGKSVTIGCNHLQAVRFNRKIVIVDTPGLFDTSRSNEDIQMEIKKCISITSPGPHALLIVLSLASRFTKEEERSLNHFIDCFGEGIYKYCIILFTRKDDLDAEESTIDEYLENVPNELKDFRKKCGNRVFPINNRLKGAENDEQIRKLLDTILSNVLQNGGDYYTNEMYQKAETIIKQIEEEKREKEKQEKQKEFEEMRKNIDKQYEEKRKKNENEVRRLKEELELVVEKQKIQAEKERKLFLEKSEQENKKREMLEKTFNEKMKSIENEQKASFKKLEEEHKRTLNLKESEKKQSDDEVKKLRDQLQSRNETLEKDKINLQREMLKSKEEDRKARENMEKSLIDMEKRFQAMEEEKKNLEEKKKIAEEKNNALKETIVKQKATLNEKEANAIKEINTKEYRDETRKDFEEKPGLIKRVWYVNVEYIK